MKIVITKDTSCDTGSVTVGEICDFVSFTMNDKKQGVYKVKKNSGVIVKVPAISCQVGE